MKFSTALVAVVVGVGLLALLNGLVERIAWALGGAGQ